MKKDICWGGILAFLNAYQPKTQLIKILNSLDSFKLYRGLLANPKGGSRKGNCFYLKISKLASCKMFDAYKPNKDVQLRPKSLSNPLEQMSSINYKNLLLLILQILQILLKNSLGTSTNR